MGKSSQWSCERQRCTLSDAACSEVRAMTLYGHQGLSHVRQHEYGCLLIVKWPCEVAVCSLAITACSFGGRKLWNA